MNTNNNVYTVIYTTVIVVIVAAALAFVSQYLKPMQEANEKAETISQILTAAQFGDKDHWQEIGNAATIKFFGENIAGNTAILSPSDLKAMNYKIKAGEMNPSDLPLYRFNNGITVFPIYGAGLWGPIWGYVAVDTDYQTIVGAYFDHESETPGLGGKIKDDPAFREQFKAKRLSFEDGQNPIDIIKVGAATTLPEESHIDAISGATMTCKGLDKAADVWMSAYVVLFKQLKSEAAAEQPVAEEPFGESVEETVENVEE